MKNYRNFMRYYILIEKMQNIGNEKIIIFFIIFKDKIPDNLIFHLIILKLVKKKKLSTFIPFCYTFQFP